MMKYLLTMLCLLAINPSRSQTYQTDVVIDSYKHSITMGDHTQVFQLQASAQLPKSIITDKKYYWYSNNQIKITQGGYSGKLLHGPYREFYFNKNLKEQGQFDMGLKVGEWNSWNIQGMLTEKTNFKKGIPEGNYYKYNGNGSLLEEGRYLHGRIHGKLTKYVGKDSTLISIYKNGELQSPKPNWLKRWFKKKSPVEINPQQ